MFGGTAEGVARTAGSLTESLADWPRHKGGARC